MQLSGHEIYERHPRVVQRPAAFERPEKTRVHEPSDDVRFGAIDRVIPFLGIRLERRTLLRKNVVVGHAQIHRHDEVCSYGFVKVEGLHRSARGDIERSQG